MSVQLATLAEIKAYLGINNTQSDMILGRLLATQSRAFLTLTYRDTLDPTVTNELRDGKGSNQLLLSKWPVISITSLTNNGIAVPAAGIWPTPGYVFQPDGTLTLVNFGHFHRARANVLCVYTYGFPTTPVIENFTTPVTGTITVQVSGGELFRSINSVKYFSTGIPLTQVMVAPTAGQFFIQPNGVFLFSAADVGTTMIFNYQQAGYPDDIRQAVVEMVAWKNAKKGRIDLNSESLNAVSTSSYSKDDYPKGAWDVMNNYKIRTWVPS